MFYRRRLQLFCQRQDLNPGSILGQPRIDPKKKHHRKNIIEKTSSKKNIFEKTSSKKHHPKNIIEKKTSSEKHHRKKNIIGRNTFRCFLLELRKAMEEER